MGNRASIIGSMAVPSDLDKHTQPKANQRPNPVFSIPDFFRNQDYKLLALQQFHQCMAAFPQELSRDYPSGYALSSILRTEAPEILFLHCEDYNPWSAAFRCIKYWSHRKRTFGDRAHRPMLAASPKGALKHVDTEILKSGAISLGIFEPSGTASGYVVCVDTQTLRSFEESATPRCIFYLLTNCMENMEEFSKGVTFVLFVDGNLAGCIAELLSWYMMITEVFPVGQVSAHIVPLGTNDSPDPDGYAANVQMEVHVHGGQHQTDVTTSLRTLGLPLNMIPPVIGGVGPMERAATWHQERLRKDFEKYGAAYITQASPASDTSASSGSGSTKHHEVSSTDTRPTPTTITVHAEERPSASPRKRKIESDLSIKADDLDRQEYIRKRNAAYSKRKYHRKKIEIEVLKKQANDMQQLNDNLRNEGQRLEDLLQSMQAQVAADVASRSNGVNRVISETQMSPESCIPGPGDHESLSLPLPNQGSLQSLIGLPGQVNVGSGWSQPPDGISSSTMLQGQGQQQTLPSNLLAAAGYFGPGTSPHGPVPAMVALHQSQNPLLSGLTTGPVMAAPSAANYSEPTPTPMAQLYSDLLSGRGQHSSQNSGLLHGAPVGAQPPAAGSLHLSSQAPGEHARQLMQGTQSVGQSDPVAQLLEQLVHALQSQNGQGS